MGLQASYGDGNCFISYFTSPARSGENVRLTRPLSHELFEKVLSIVSPILYHTLKKYAHPNVDGVTG